MNISHSGAFVVFCSYLTLTIPSHGNYVQGTEYFVTLVLSAKNTTNGASNYTAMAEVGLEELVVFQTDTTQPDSSARVLAGLSLVSLTWLVLFNTLLASIGSMTGVQRETVVPTLGW